MVEQDNSTGHLRFISLYTKWAEQAKFGNEPEGLVTYQLLLLLGDDNSPAK